MIAPAQVPLHLVARIEPVPLHQAGRQAQRHGRVVGPWPGLELKWPATYHAGEWREATARAEFYSRADRVAHR